MTNKFLIFNIILFSILTPGWAQSSVENGEKYLKENQIKQAKKVFEEHKDNIQAIEYLGDIASFEKKWDEAIHYYEKLVENQPNSSGYNFKLGGAMGMKAMDVSKFKAALMLGDIKTHLNKAAELDKNHAEVRRALVELYIQLPVFIGGSKDLAQQYVKELQSINKVDAYLAQAYIHKTEEDQEAVKIAVNKALEEAKNNKNLVERNYMNYELGERAASLGLKPDMAVDFLENYIKNYNYKDLKSPAWAHFHIAKIQASKNNQDKALSHINKALANKFNFPEAEKLKQQILEM
ncbi:tetratricopeptide repeat protein [Salegentibacter salegens]|uniref:Tetratricopeptide repeat-containing protein n=1 Tax=Salegentibacter salegens TaxID=143223 RepID=A0A1M7HUZ1_9FLAO|nr:tetratricopeptide repeat protein [Salegentibacter salegens]PRX45220.1 tetratricopeptide repeat protein [Salegentibacter salegens]SHM32304.1 Tetratricopeptide repeat-containing protein [Salegentibacter salegens]